MIYMKFSQNDNRKENEIEELKSDIVNSFLSILKKRNSKTRSSKHHVLGPIGKLISKLRGGYNLDEIKGTILRIIEMDEDFGNIVGASIINNLENAIDNLKNLKEIIVSDAEWHHILSELDYRTFFEENKRIILDSDRYIKEKWRIYRKEKEITSEQILSKFPYLKNKDINPYDISYEFFKEFGEKFKVWLSINK